MLRSETQNFSSGSAFLAGTGADASSDCGLAFVSAAEAWCDPLVSPASVIFPDCLGSSKRFGGGARFILAFATAANGDGVRVREHDLNILLFYSRELTMKLVGAGQFFDIKARVERRKTASRSSATAVVVEVVQEPE